MQRQHETTIRILLSLLVLSGFVGYGLRNERQLAVSANTIPAIAVASTPTVLRPSPQSSTIASSPMPAATNQAPAQSSMPMMSPATNYHDGTYTVVGQYEAPDGMDQIQVSVTIRNDVVTAADVTSMARRRTTAEFQQLFIAAYTPDVVGKKIDSIRLFRVAGASLTTDGFNNALAQIKSKAAA